MKQTKQFMQQLLLVLGDLVACTVMVYTCFSDVLTEEPSMMSSSLEQAARAAAQKMAAPSVRSLFVILFIAF